MRVVIATRIFGPEVSAASAILRTWAEEFRDRGHEVTVLTARPPRGFQIADPAGIRVRRARVKRDKQQYVRGYLSYMSFDVPLAFRLLFSRRADLYIAEPPPTTVAVVRVAAALKRAPYVVRAADFWSEAAELVTDSRIVLGLLRRTEKWGLQGAKMLFAAHQPLLDRFREFGVTAPAIPIGFGADPQVFTYSGQHPSTTAPFFVYAGTYSEWHGARIFVDAMPAVLKRHPRARIVFYGNGEERVNLAALADELGVGTHVEFEEPIPPAELAPILSGATASLASLLPDPRNEYAVATKVYSSFASGCPVVFTGVGPTHELVLEAPFGGHNAAYEPAAVAAVLIALADEPLGSHARETLAQWAAETHSLHAIATNVVDSCEEIVRGTSGLRA
jgi:glycosyltransferase involved in cell wall biosynthesis